MSADLLPCPFCGHKVIAFHNHERSAKTASRKHFFVRCPSCHTEGPRSTLNLHESAERWNRRAPVQAQGVAATAENAGDLLDGLQATATALQKFKSDWMRVPHFADRVNKATRDAISMAIGPMVNLDAVGGPLDLSKYARPAAVGSGDLSSAAALAQAQQQDAGAWRQRAEKAEAEVKKVNAWRTAALNQSHEMGEMWAARVMKAEARVEELEAAQAPQSAVAWPAQQDDARDAALSEAAALCGAIFQDYRDQYKGRGKYRNGNNPNRADTRCDGMADGASECEDAILNLKAIAALTGSV